MLVMKEATSELDVLCKTPCAFSTTESTRRWWDEMSCSTDCNTITNTQHFVHASKQNKLKKPKFRTTKKNTPGNARPWQGKVFGGVGGGRSGCMQDKKLKFIYSILYRNPLLFDSKLKSCRFSFWSWQLHELASTEQLYMYVIFSQFEKSVEKFGITNAAIITIKD